MKLVTKEEFKKWIKCQPDDKEVSLASVRSTDKVCCPLSEFTKQRCSPTKEFIASYDESYYSDFSSRILKIEGLGCHGFFELFDEEIQDWKGLITYRELKKHLLES